MKNTLIILVILIFSSCTNKIDLVGDWKATLLVVNNTDSVEVPIFQPTFFKSDSLVIYFGRLMRYHMKGDSIIFINDIEPTDTKQAVIIATPTAAITSTTLFLLVL